MILHLIFGKQVFKEMRRDLLTNIVSLAGKESAIKYKVQNNFIF